MNKITLVEVILDRRERTIEGIGIISSALYSCGPCLIGLPRGVPSIVIDVVSVVVGLDLGVVGGSGWEDSLKFRQLSVVSFSLHWVSANSSENASTCASFEVGDNCGNLVYIDQWSEVGDGVHRRATNGIIEVKCVKLSFVISLALDTAGVSLSSCLSVCAVGIVNEAHAVNGIGEWSNQGCIGGDGEVCITISIYESSISQCVCPAVGIFCSGASTREEALPSFHILLLALKIRLQDLKFVSSV